jgi:glycosyltransferase involved in cell wall biosynthesis
MAERTPEPGVSVLHVPYTYFPDSCGGTEIYVRQLALRLRDVGCPSAIAAPGACAARYRLDGLDVYRFSTDREGIGLAYGVPDKVAADGFRAILEETRPAVVHLHARTAAVSECLVDLAHEAGARVAFTYHTPTVSCGRGTMMLFGATPCDGAIEAHRCTACVIEGQGAPKLVARLCAQAPKSVGALSRVVGGAKLGTAVRIIDLLRGSRDRFDRFITRVDHVVAVCEWVYRVLRQNGVPEWKMTLSRQGISNGQEFFSNHSIRVPGDPLMIGYFGRVDRTKGVDLLVNALAKLPGVSLRLDIFAVNQSIKNRELDRIVELASRDSRISVHPALPPETVRTTMAAYDFVAIPSRWLETGPLVALEAFSAGTPVLGANLGGIAELVRHGIDGILVKPDDVAAWTGALREIAENRESVRKLRSNILPPRTMTSVADDMLALYAQKLSR